MYEQFAVGARVTVLGTGEEGIVTAFARAHASLGYEYFVYIEKPHLKKVWIHESNLTSYREEKPVHHTKTTEQVIAELREVFPYGHPDFIPNLVRLMKLHNDKNHDYARGGNPLGNFQRVATILKQYPNFPYDTPEGVAFIYALKQVDAEAWTMCQGGECKVEGLQGRTDDQLVYAGIRECIRAEKLDASK